MPDLPIPDHFDPKSASEIFRVDYQARAADAERWAREHAIAPAGDDERQIALLVVDVQNTFCLPGHELYVGGRSGTGAVDDNVRLCRFLYRNLDAVTRVIATLDTHHALQIFHPAFLVDRDGNHPTPMTAISVEAVERGDWRIDPRLAAWKGLEDDESLQAYLLYYVTALRDSGKYELMVWPYHAMLGGVGHALVAAVEEAIFFHDIARVSPSRLTIKGEHPLTENYSALRPEVNEALEGEPIQLVDESLIEELLGYDAVIVAGQAKSHCVAWTVSDLLDAIDERAPEPVAELYLLEDCSSPVVVPDVVDFTDQADQAYERFARRGVHVVRSTTPLDDWPGMS